MKNTIVLTLSIIFLIVFVKNRYLTIMGDDNKTYNVHILTIHIPTTITTEFGEEIEIGLPSAGEQVTIELLRSKYASTWHLCDWFCSSFNETQTGKIIAIK